MELVLASEPTGGVVHLGEQGVGGLTVAVLEDLPAFQDVGQDHVVHMSDMRGGIDVEDGRGDVVWLGRFIPAFRASGEAAALALRTGVADPLRTPFP